MLLSVRDVAGKLGGAAAFGWACNAIAELGPFPGTDDAPLTVGGWATTEAKK